MHPSPAVSAGVTILIVLVCSMAAYALGKSDARSEQRDRADDAAAAICPTCSAFEAPARRLSLAHARISGIEYYGRHYAQTEDDVVDDANAIILTAIHHIDRLDRRLAGR